MIAHVKPKQEIEPDKTGGEKLFDWVTYFGVGWLINAAIGVKVAMMSEDGNDAVGQARERGANENPIIFKVREGLYNARYGAVKGAQNAVDQHYNNNHYYRTTAAEVTKSINASNPNFSEAKAQQYFYNNYKQTDGGFRDLAQTLDVSVEDVTKTRDMLVNKQRIKGSATTLATAGAISVGGFICMVPIKILEDNKLAITKKFDNVLDNVASATGHGFISEYQKEEVMKARQERYDFIDKAPKQSWGSVLGSRIASLIPFYTTYIAVAAQDNIISGMGAKLSGNDYANPSAGYQGTRYHIDQGIRGVIGKAEQHVPGVAGLMNNYKTDGQLNAKFMDKANFWATDVGFSWFVAEMTYSFTRLLGPLMNKGKESPQADATPAEELKIDVANHRAFTQKPVVYSDKAPDKSVRDASRHGEVTERTQRESYAIA